MYETTNLRFIGQQIEKSDIGHELQRSESHRMSKAPQTWEGFLSIYDDAITTMTSAASTVSSVFLHNQLTRILEHWETNFH